MIQGSSGELVQAGAAGFRWSAFGGIARLFGSFVIQVALTRLLAPDEFGEMTAAMLAIGLGLLISDFGLTQALVQRSGIVSGDFRKTLIFQSVVSLSLVGLMLVTADDYGRFFDSEMVGDLVKGLSGVLLISTIGMPSLGLLRREMQFKHIQISQVGAYVAGFGVVGIPLAASGAGVWGLVIAQYVQALLTSAILLSFGRKVHLLQGRGSLFDSLKLSSKMLPSNLAQWSVINVPNVSIGRVLGTASLGLFNRAFTLVVNPVYAVVGPTQSVVHSTYSRLRASQSAAKGPFLAMWSLSIVFCFPALLSVSFNADTVVVALFGEKWLSVSPLLPAIGLAMCSYVISSFTGPIIMGMGFPAVESRIQVLSAVVLVVLIMYAVRFSLSAASWAVFAGHTTSALLLTVGAIRILDLSVGSFTRFLAGPTLSAMLITGGTVLVDRVVRGLIELPLIVLSADVIAGLTLTMLLTLTVPSFTLGNEGKEAIAELLRGVGASRISAMLGA